MLVAPTSVTKRSIPPGFIDFTSSSFDSILYPNTTPLNEQDVEEENVPDTNQIKRRVSNLPDFIPFIQLITDKCDVQPVHLVMALMYVNRFRKSLPAGYKAEPEAAHRIFAASLLVASKYSDDRYISTKQVVRATGDVWSLKEMAQMELAFLRFLHWDLFVSQDEMALFVKELGFDLATLLPGLPHSSLKDISF